MYVPLQKLTLLHKFYMWSQDKVYKIATSYSTCEGEIFDVSLASKHPTIVVLNILR